MQARWLSPAGTAGPIIDVSGKGPNPEPRVAVGSNGDAILAWTHTRGYAGLRHIVARSLSPAGSLGALHTVFGLNAGAARLVIADDGSATFAWVASNASFSTSRVQARSRSANSELGSTVSLSTAAEIAADPDLALAPNGTAIVAWTRKAGSIRTVRAAVGP